MVLCLSPLVDHEVFGVGVELELSDVWNLSDDQAVFDGEFSAGILNGCWVGKMLPQHFHLPSIAVEEDRLFQEQELIIVVTLGVIWPFRCLVLESGVLILGGGFA